MAHAGHDDGPRRIEARSHGAHDSPNVAANIAPCPPRNEFPRPAVLTMLSAFTARPIIELKPRDKSKIESILAYGRPLPWPSVGETSTDGAQATECLWA